MFGEIMCGIFDLSGGYVDVIGSIVLICVLMCDVVWVVFVDVGQIVLLNVWVLLCDYCFDYVILLVLYQWIVDMVGYVYGMECLFVCDCEQFELEEKGIVGICSVMLWLFDMVWCFVCIDVLVFVFGEMGIGKEFMVLVIYCYLE